MNLAFSKLLFTFLYEYESNDTRLASVELLTAKLHEKAKRPARHARHPYIKQNALLDQIRAGHI